MRTTLPRWSERRTVRPSVSASATSDAREPEPPDAAPPPHAATPRIAISRRTSFTLEVMIEELTVHLHGIAVGLGAGGDREDLARVSVDEHVGGHGARVEIAAHRERAVDENGSSQAERLRPRAR